MTTSNYITLILLGVIGLVFLIDYILNSRKKSLEKSVEKFVEKESGKQEGFFNRFLQKINVKTFFWVYPFSFSFFWVFLFVAFSFDKNGKYYNFDYVLHDINSNFPDVFTFGFFSLCIGLFVFHFLWFINSRYDNWILKRKKNVVLFIISVLILKVLLHYFIYPEFTAKKIIYSF